jgi:phosphatidylserine/phosphatidylglycerophosphate/cardiolipin synthase-like enzyme
VHGATYFARLRAEVEALVAGDLLLFTDWRGDPDQLLDGPDTEVARIFAAAVRRGVLVKGLIWRSHLDRFKFSAQQNRQLGEDIHRAGGECIRDMRVRIGGSHHQKFVILRHRDRPELDVAFAGGIDLCHSRGDDEAHAGDHQPQPMADVYGPRPPWHDVQLEIRGPAVGDLELSFRERWNDPTPVTRNPVYRMLDMLRHEDDHPDPLPEQWPDPPPAGPHTVQVLRTYPVRRAGYPFARNGERSIARAYDKVIGRAEQLIYLEDQYFWGDDVPQCFADALRANPQLRLIAVVPHHPDQDGRLNELPQLVARRQALELVRRAAPDRVAIYGVENLSGTPVYVHAKVCVVDDVWASVGSDNVNRRSWTHDSELSCAVLDEQGRFARELRLQLAREHLDRAAGNDADLVDAASVFEQFRESARALQDWYDGGRQGARPPGRLRPFRLAPLRRLTRLWATPMYRVALDPDGRNRALRRQRTF